MNIDTIVNEVIAGLILSFLISLITFIFNFLRKKHKENPSLFAIKVHFYFSVAGTICSSISLTIKDKALPEWLVWTSFVFNIAFLVTAFYNALYYKDSNS